MAIAILVAHTVNIRSSYRGQTTNTTTTARRIDDMGSALTTLPLEIDRMKRKKRIDEANYGMARARV